MNVRSVFAAATAVAWFASPAGATLLFSANVDAVPTIVCADNQAAGGLCPGDTNPAIGTLSLAAGVFGGVSLNGSVQSSQLSNPSILNSSSLNITNTTGATVHIDAAVGDIGFVGPVTSAVTSASGTVQQGIGSTFAYAFYNDPNNVQGAGDPFTTPGVLLDSFSFTSTLIADAYAHAGGPFAVVDPGLFSMTQTFVADLVAGGQLVGNSETMIKTPQVDEPQTLALLGVALLGLWFSTRVGRGRGSQAA